MKRRRCEGILRLLASAAAASAGLHVVAPPRAAHASVTWGNGTGDATWANPSNWSTNSLPSSSDSVVLPDPFPGPGTLSSIVVPANAAAHDLMIAGSYTLNGGALTAGGNIDTPATAAVINSLLTGTNGLTKLGTGTLTITAANTFTGTTTLNAGTLSIPSANSTPATAQPLGTSASAILLGSAALQYTGVASGTLNRPITLSAGAVSTIRTAAGPFTIGTSGQIHSTGPASLSFDAAGGDLTASASVSGSITVIKTGPGALSFGSTNTYTGGTILRQGTLNCSSPANLGSGDISFEGGTLRMLTPTLSKNLMLNGAGTVDTGGLNVLCSTAVAGTGSFNKTGNGILTLSGTANYSGSTTVTAGSLRLSPSSGQTFNFPAVTVNANAKLILSAGSNTVLRTPSLSIGAGGVVDIQISKIIIPAGDVGSFSGSAYTGIAGLIQSGRNGTALPLWDGSGIVSTHIYATGGNYYSIGVARASDVRPSTATTTALWAGQSITGADVLIMCTYGGDANLDGKVNVDDYVRIDNGIAGHLSGWSNGDFNYDGKVNIDDYTSAIDSNIGGQTGTFFTAISPGPQASGAPVAVPEISSLPGILLTVAACGMLRTTPRRRLA